MKSKITGFLITLALLAGLCLTASIPVMAAGTTWYVDDSNAGAEDGSAAHPYNSIEEAITAAANDDIIIVAAGTYNEDNSISKRLIIRAATGAMVTVNASSGSAFLIIDTTAVSIDGFNIINGGITIMRSHSCVVTGNSVSGNSNIRVIDSNENIIADNDCSDSTETYGIVIDNSNGNIITKNTFDSFDSGIYLDGSMGNTVSGNSTSGGRFGIFLADNSSENIVTCNTISGATQAGIYVYSGAENTFIYNTMDANIRGFFFNNGGTIDAGPINFRYNNITNNTTGVYNNGSGTLVASYNYWSGNTSDTGGTVTTDNRADMAYVYTYPYVAFVTTTTFTTETETTTTETETVETTETAYVMITGVVTNTETRTFTATDTVTLLVPLTVTETQSLTSTDTSTSSATQTATVADTQTVKFTVTVPQTINQTATTTLTLTGESTDWEVIIFVLLGGLLTGGLIITIILKRM